MAIQRTLSMIKPDAVEKNKTGAILAMFQDAGRRPCMKPIPYLKQASASRRPMSAASSRAHESYRAAQRVSPVA